jgi:hypothetical protein
VSVDAADGQEVNVLSKTRKLTWPAEPYRGLAYYGPEDALLFVGREDDVDECVHFLSELRTRVLLLHGQTGCGKSSFLRAGLIPALEGRGFGYQFLREGPGNSGHADEDDDGGKPIFIRAGPDPISRIAEDVFQFSSRRYIAKTAAGPQELFLGDALLGYERIEDFVTACREPRVLLDALAKLSSKLLHTLVVIVDQAEEVITLTQPLDNERRIFLDSFKISLPKRLK